MRNFIWGVIFFLFSFLPVLTTVKILALSQDRVPEKSEYDDHSERGPIFDRKGNILAMQINSWNVGLRLIDTNDPEEVISTLSKILKIPKETLEKKLYNNPNKYVRVKKHISKEEYEAILALKRQNKLVGVQFNEIFWRRYPGNESLSFLIGYYGEDGKGLDGVESTFDRELRAGNSSPLGNSIFLTVDSILQSSIEEIVHETLIESKSSFINTILMDGKTGEILAFVSLPGFDLNQYYTYSQKELNNKLIRYNYEPGSVFKVFSIAGLLDKQSISVNSFFDARGPYVNSQYNFTIQDLWYPGYISTPEIIKYSSNVGISRAVENIDNESFYQYLVDFGFGQKTGVELPGESHGILNKPQYWSARSKPTIALGQEIAVTAMQLVTAASVFTNNGQLLQPQIIKKITSPDGKTLYSASPKKKRVVLREGVARQVLQMMKFATEPGGTAHRLSMDGIHISAKTGTAQVFDPETGSYSSDSFIASTLSIIPTENPRLIIYSAIHNPTSGEIYGGRTTAPMIRKMLNFILPYLGYLEQPKSLEGENAKWKLQNEIATKKAFKIGSRYGDYTGMSKREAWMLFINSNVRLQIFGSGVVVDQTPKPGTEVTQDSVLSLYFQ